MKNSKKYETSVCLRKYPPAINLTQNVLNGLRISGGSLLQTEGPLSNFIFSNYKMAVKWVNWIHCSDERWKIVLPCHYANCWSFIRLSILTRAFLAPSSKKWWNWGQIVFRLSGIYALLKRVEWSINVMDGHPNYTKSWWNRDGGRNVRYNNRIFALFL